MKELHFKSRYLWAACLAALLLFSSGAVAQETSANPEGSVDPEVLQLKIPEVEA